MSGLGWPGGLAGHRWIVAGGGAFGFGQERSLADVSFEVI